MTPADRARLQTLAQDHLWAPSRKFGGLFEDVPLIVSGQGVWVEDVDGRRYLDAMSALWLNQVGHGRTEIAEAVAQQLARLAFSPVGTLAPPTLELAGALVALTRMEGARVFFTSGGTESNETALKMARRYHQLRGEPRRQKFIARRGSYHGASFMTMALGRAALAAPDDYGEMPEQVLLTMQPAPEAARDLTSVDDLEAQIESAGPGTVAAFIAEPFSAHAGMVDPGAGYWRAVRHLCDRHGILLIFDEVLTGFGRTGRNFAFEHYGLQPDLLSLAKGLTSGYSPMGAVVASRAFSEVFGAKEAPALRHMFTYGGNPGSAAAALANLRILEREQLVENARVQGAYLLTQLRTLEALPIVGQVRGIGLLCGVELVKDRQTRERFPTSAGVSGRAARALRAQGVLTRGGDLLAIAPPLCITREEIDLLVTGLRAGLTALGQSLL